MTGMTIGQAFDKRGPFAVTGLFDGGRCSAVDYIGIITIDYDFLQTISPSAVTC